ncbi:L-aspartate oxidase [Acetobacterium woodii]|uniref:L-aspartate oxidase n=1 Tax=Acetobacterium woodii (strain ATCC 29683 / DSM 1030 / JCM 2381 / KCTC 1655 / WB1) TaxID=931626 RepID=H6LG38_ACEWD|nr:L-aspartate oxidase [Acetobacterium woodii]AFA49514.1 fumarate reductase Frd [Acetobacterium woodii DSM 1030]
MNGKTDIIVVGTGASGLFYALNIPANKHVQMITKTAVDESDSYLAQGGICVLRNEDDYDSFFEDTLKAGHYENDPDSVEVMIRTSPEIIADLLRLGVEFETRNGELAYTKEGAHSKPRILYHEDLTGKEITSKLLAQVRKRKNITIIENMAMIDLICQQNRCSGVVANDKNGQIHLFNADYVVLATGGLGGLFHSSTNLQHLTGDAIAIALKRAIALENISYIQIHPTTLYSQKPGRRFLISESVRGEGAVLYNRKMQRFVDELLPRDLLTKAIQEQMAQDESDFVWLSMQKMGSDVIKVRFPNIYQHCLEEGYDITRECIPVTPAQHYFMGGVKVNLESRTSMEHLYAVGEISCNRVHGANRLASNSLLESLVFAKRAANDTIKYYETARGDQPMIDFADYQDLEQLKFDYKTSILDEIERSKVIERIDHKKA